LETGTIKEFSFYSNALAEELKLYIYLPADYTPMMTYPVIIAADGKDYIQLGRVSGVMNELIENGDIDDTIFVAIPYKSVQDRRDKYLPSGIKHEAYLTFLTEELLPYLDANYSTEDAPEARTLIGDSQAATISLLAALRHPEKFHHIIMHSPYVNEEVMEIVRKVHNVKDYTVYHAIGKKETEVRTTDHQIKDFLTPNRELHALMVAREFNVYYVELEGDHTWKTWQPDLHRAFIQNFLL